MISVMATKVPAKRARPAAAGQPRSGDELLLDALVAYESGDPKGARALLEQAYRTSVDAGDELGAVRASTRLVLVNEALGDYDAARGWDQRGWRHLEGLGPNIERGYHAVAWVGCEIEDPNELLEKAELALGVAREFKDHQLELRAMADKGLALVGLGKVDQGMALMDDVMVGISSGEIPTASLRGLTYCALMSACERTGDSGRANYWGQAIERDEELVTIGLPLTHCTIARGMVDAMRGEWDDADAKLQQALAAQPIARMHAAQTVAALADLRIQKGRYEEAAELLKGYEDDFNVAPALATLKMTTGDYVSAAALLRSYTRSLGSDCMRQAPALALLVTVELARDDLPAATRSLKRLQQLQEGDCSSNEVRSQIRLAKARVDSYNGDYDTAIDELETGLALLVHRERPLLNAHLRLELARALGKAGQPESAAVEAEAALAIFDRLGVTHDAAEASNVLAEVRRAGAASKEARQVVHAPGAVEALTDSEAEVAQLVADGLTTDAIGDRLSLPKTGVQIHMERALGKLDMDSREELADWVRSGTPVQGRVLATVMFTDIVGSTEKAVELGDRRWKELLDEHDRTVHAVVNTHGGRVVNHTGDGILATFDGPNGALRSAAEMRQRLGERGIKIRTGVHTGEVELRGENIGGVAVHTAARVMAKAGADEIMVSSTVRDLVAGSGTEFRDAGEFELKGLPGTWRLLAVTHLPA